LTLYGKLAEILQLCEAAKRNSGIGGAKEKRPAMGMAGLNYRWLRGQATSLAC
jgi:hypothetical protein